MKNYLTILGAGLAGSEAAWQAAERGISVVLYEMRPVKPTPVHKTDHCAELVCSNSLGSKLSGSAPFLLKEELRHLNSLVMYVHLHCIYLLHSKALFEQELDYKMNLT